MLLFRKFKLKYEMHNKTLYVQYSGSIFKEEIEEIMNKIYQQVILNNAKMILIDARESDLRLEVKESLEIADNQPIDLKTVKTAIVEKKEKENQYRLFEMFAKNRGYAIRFFNHQHEAEKWLNL